MEKNLIRGVPRDKHVARISLVRSRICPASPSGFRPTGANNINVDIILQSIGRGTPRTSFTVSSQKQAALDASKDIPGI